MARHRRHDRATQRRALWVALAANGCLLLVEVVGGLAFNSLALLADAAHMLSDVFGLAIALTAQSLMGRPATSRHTYGLQRAEVLGAQINGLVLLAAAGWIFYEALSRLGTPEHVVGSGVVAVASAGLAVNVGSAITIGRVQGHSLNMRGAFLHMTLDAVGSGAALTAGIAVLLWNARWVDPAVSLLVGGLVVWSAWELLEDTTHVLLEGTPRGMSVAEIERALEGQAHVESVHHLHLWNLASDVPALSAHVVLTEEGSLHEAQLQGDRLKEMLQDRYGIEHVTLELECHSCAPAPPDPPRVERV